MMWLYFATPVINIVATFYTDNLVHKNIALVLYTLIVIAGFPIAALCCIEKLRQGFKPALFYLIAISTPLIGAALMAVKMSNFFNGKYFPSKVSLYWPPNPLQIGLCLESVIICLGILYRYNLYKREKEGLALALEKEKTNSAEQVLIVQEDERKRIAEDLHDELGGNLAAIKMTLQSLKLPEEKTKLLIQLIDYASTNARNISHNLMPPEFKDANIKDLLFQLYQRINQEGSIVFHFHCSSIVYSFDKHKELMLYRIILELTNNIIKHAEATEATMQLIYYESYLEIMAEDNGKGFSNDSVDGIGLKNIRSRVNYLNGTINIDSNMTGSTIMIQVPYQT